MHPAKTTGGTVEEKRVRVGVVGFGTVGAGVAKLILEDADAIAAKMGVRPELACVVDTDTERPRPVQLPPGVLTNDLNRLLNDPSIRIGVELVGGTGIAKEIQTQDAPGGQGRRHGQQGSAGHARERTVPGGPRERPVHRV